MVTVNGRFRDSGRPENHTSMFSKTRRFKFPYAVTESLKKLQARWKIVAALILSWALLLAWVKWDGGLDQKGGMQSQKAVSETLAMHIKQILTEADLLVWRLARQASVQDHDHSWLDSVLEEAKLSSLISGLAIYDENQQLLMSAGHINVNLSAADLEALEASSFVVLSEPSLTLVSRGDAGPSSRARIVKYRVNLGYFHQMLHFVIGDEPWLLLLMGAHSFEVFDAYPGPPTRWRKHDVQRALSRYLAQGKTGDTGTMTYFSGHQRHVLSISTMRPWPLLLVSESLVRPAWSLLHWTHWTLVVVLALGSWYLLYWDRRRRRDGTSPPEPERVGHAMRVFERMFEALPDAVIMFDARARVEGVNSAMRRLLACPQGQDGPRCLKDFVRLLQAGNQTGDPADNAGSTSLSYGLSGVIERVQREFRSMQVQPGSEPARVLEMRAYAASEPDDATLVVIRDVTLQVELDRMRSEFLSLAAHELRAPLASVSGYIELLELGLVAPERQPRVLAQVREKARDMTALLENLVRLNRIEYAGDWRQDWRELDLRALLRLGLRAFDESRHRIRLELPPQALRASVEAMQLLVAVRNALENALEYSEAHTEVVVRLRPSSPGWACIEIIDQGPGIARIYHNRIFDKFFRVPGHKVQGTGLGLAILKSIVVNHGGRVYLHPAARQGTHLVIELILLSSASYIA